MDNRVSTGIGMLLAPLIIYLVYLLVKSQIDWGKIVNGVMITSAIVVGLAYVVLAFVLIIKGAFEDD